MLYSTVKDLINLEVDLNYDLDLISRWVHQRNMEFKPDPTKRANEILFYHKTSNQNHPQLIFDGVPVAKVKEP